MPTDRDKIREYMVMNPDKTRVQVAKACKVHVSRVHGTINYDKKKEEAKADTQTLVDYDGCPECQKYKAIIALLLR